MTPTKRIRREFLITLLILGDDGTDGLTLEGSGDAPFLHAIHDLNWLIT
jgi:hypothetical protein